ncbi:MAG: YggS family pyridoxal phosphate-dependent enzyme [Clostridia bacterium]|nr:YggS family pyridoxal phosphate-dependent enzyme [Clostridia bacterium]
MIKENLKKIMASLPDGVTLLGASKTVPAEYINFAADCGLKVIGENRVNELLSKYDDIDKEKLEIHFIGQLQTNKVKYIIDKVSLIHSVDSLRLAEEISRRAVAKGLLMPVLVEINIGGEESKGGILPEEAEAFIKKISLLEGIRVEGIMAIPPKCDEEHKNIEIYQKLSKIFIDIKAQNVDNVNMRILSVGMSGDWETAVEHGSNMVRIGSGIFGSRIYN